MKTKATKKAVCKKAAPKAAAKAVTKMVTFTLHADKGKEVFLAGEFNGWSTSAKKMAYKARQGLYATTIKLAPGEYQYKFVVDGVWCADPENANAVANDQGTFNSIAVVLGA